MSTVSDFSFVREWFASDLVSEISHFSLTWRFAVDFSFSGAHVLNFLDLFLSLVVSILLFCFWSSPCAKDFSVILSVKCFVIWLVTPAEVMNLFWHTPQQNGLCAIHIIECPCPCAEFAYPRLHALHEYLSVCVAKCCVRRDLKVNWRWQIVQPYGWPRRQWEAYDSNVLNHLPHVLHSKYFSIRCLSIWQLKEAKRLKTLPHGWHSYVSSKRATCFTISFFGLWRFMWQRMWSLTAASRSKDFLHSPQENGLSGGWLRLCSCRVVLFSNRVWQTAHSNTEPVACNRRCESREMASLKYLSHIWHWYRVVEMELLPDVFGSWPVLSIFCNQLVYYSRAMQRLCLKSLKIKKVLYWCVDCFRV